jgi:hypothetical protein
MLAAIVGTAKSVAMTRGALHQKRALPKQQPVLSAKARIHL